MSLEAGFMGAMLIMVLGALGLTAFAIHLRAKAPAPKPEKQQFTAVIERCNTSGLYVGYVPGIPGAHAQAATLEELNTNLQAVLGMLLADGVHSESRFVGTQLIVVT